MTDAIRLQGALIVPLRHFAIALIERIPDRPAREPAEQNASQDGLGAATRRSPDQAARRGARCGPHRGIRAHIRARNHKKRTAEQRSGFSQLGSRKALHPHDQPPMDSPPHHRSTGGRAQCYPGARGPSTGPLRTPVKLEPAALEVLDRHRYISLVTFRRVCAPSCALAFGQSFCGVAQTHSMGSRS